MSRRRRALVPIVAACALACALVGGGSVAQADEGAGVEWRLAQPSPPPAPAGAEAPPGVIGLGRIGDIAFEAPNRGALITAGNPPAVPAGVWEYNGVAWHELSEVCGATDGRIVWSGPEEFWTISDGRPGQALVEGIRPPLTDNTLCRFSNPKHEGEPLQVLESFAFPAFQSNSYMAMHGAACLSETNCWFGGDPLPRSSIDAGAFQLHWDGRSLAEEPYPVEGRSIQDMTTFAGRIFESTEIGEKDRTEEELPRPPAIHAIDPQAPLFEGFDNLPLYEEGELPWALTFLHLAAGGEFLWAAGGPVIETPEESEPGRITILRATSLGSGEGSWAQVVGPLAPLNTEPFPGQTVTAIAAEPGSEEAWIGLDSPTDARKPSAIGTAVLARVSARPSEPAGPATSLPGAHGAVWKIACPAANDCWLATASGWLYHLSSQAQERIEQDPDQAFETLITERPADQGLPQQQPDTLPEEFATTAESKPETTETKPDKLYRSLPLLTHVHSKLVRRTTLELRFHLAVKAKVRLIAKRAKRVVASTPRRTLKAGDRSLLLQLNTKEWPTKISMQTHALAPLPKVPVGSGQSEDSFESSLAFHDLTSVNGL